MWKICAVHMSGPCAPVLSFVATLGLRVARCQPYNQISSYWSISRKTIKRNSLSYRSKLTLNGSCTQIAKLFHHIKTAGTKRRHPKSFSTSHLKVSKWIDPYRSRTFWANSSSKDRIKICLPLPTWQPQIKEMKLSHKSNNNRYWTKIRYQRHNSSKKWVICAMQQINSLIMHGLGVALANKLQQAWQLNITHGIAGIKRRKRWLLLGGVVVLVFHYQITT